MPVETSFYYSYLDRLCFLESGNKNHEELLCSSVISKNIAYVLTGIAYWREMLAKKSRRPYVCMYPLHIYTRYLISNLKRKKT